MSKTREDVDRLEVERRNLLQALFWEDDAGADKSVLESRLQEIEDRIEKRQRGLLDLQEEARRTAEEEERRIAQLRGAQQDELHRLLDKKHEIAEQLDGHLNSVPVLLKEYLELGREAYGVAHELGMHNADLCLSDEHLLGYVRALLWGVLPSEALEPGPVYKRRLADIDAERRARLAAEEAAPGLEDPHAPSGRAGR